LTADEASNSYALLVVSRSSSRCSSCGQDALPARRHTYTGSSAAGCGVEFYGVTSLYAGRYFREATEELGEEAGLPYVHTVPEAGGTIVLVRNYDDAIRFYVGVLGLRVEEDLTIEPGGRRWVLLDACDDGDRLLLLEPRLAPRSFVKMHHVFTRHTDDLWRTVAELKDKGVAFVRDAEATEFGMAAELEDPDGNRIAVLCSTKKRT
jgi:catechol 2,3-dioxygenase-like lactoylglutathione lyase family enzyme